MRVSLPSPPADFLNSTTSSSGPASSHISSSRCRRSQTTDLVSRQQAPRLSVASGASLQLDERRLLVKGGDGRGRRMHRTLLLVEDTNRPPDHFRSVCSSFPLVGLAVSISDDQWRFSAARIDETPTIVVAP